MSGTALSVRDLAVTLEDGGRSRAVVDGVSFDLAHGEILGLVGESGSGKTVACRALLRLLPSPRLSVSRGAAILSGQDGRDGQDVLAMGADALRRVRGRRIGMIFQNPTSHLDPVMRIGEQIAGSLRFHHGLGRREARREAVETLRQVGIPDPAGRANSYPHEFSGGMRQRAMIAVALACRPDVLIADEPTTALDVTVQAQILRLLLELRDARGLSIILITHDLGVVAQACDGIAVLYGGRVAERGPKRAVLSAPVHPYTDGLIRCQPGSLEGGRLATIAGQPPTVFAMPDGCRFHPRCAWALPVCASRQPPLREFRPAQSAACHNPLHAPAAGNAAAGDATAGDAAAGIAAGAAA